MEKLPTVPSQEKIQKVNIVGLLVHDSYTNRHSLENSTTAYTVSPMKYSVSTRTQLFIFQCEKHKEKFQASIHG